MRSPAALTLKDAVRVISGRDDSLVNLLDRALGGALVATSVATASVVPLGLLEPKNELIGSIREKSSALTASLKGASVPDRSRTIHAAHGVLVIVSFLDALDVTLGDLAGRLELTRNDLLAFATGQRGSDGVTKSTVLAALATADLPTPSPHLAFEAVLEELSQYYERVASQVTHLISGLSLWDDLNQTQRAGVVQLLEDELPQTARGIYERDFVRLAKEAPELAIWSNLQEHMATRAAVAEGTRSLVCQVEVLEEAIDTGLTGVRETLQRISEAIEADKSRWHYSLSQAYEHELRRPIVATDDEQLAGVSSPSVSEGFINHRFRVAEYAGSDCRPESEYWWSDYAVREDIATFLSAYLTSPRAAAAPLLLLGHPGAGKSTLSRVLAGQLPSAGFLPIRVTLREVTANASVRGQIDDALYRLLGEQVSWAELVGSVSNAMPVVILDGFDELLQATGVSRSDYLEQVSQFQEIERSQGRAVAVIVTSRTAVADRARVPYGSIVLKLEPFSEGQVRRWIDVWNESNAAAFSERGIEPLLAETVLAHKDLSSQPILLLMLAFYDAAENSLQREAEDLPEATLYERLLVVFVRREVRKDGANLDENALSKRVALELDNLSVVALAMFNRDRQVVRERELDDDFRALHLAGADHTREGFYEALSPAQRILGRFFFVHKSEASEAAPMGGRAGFESRGTLGRSFEFLHATFGEYLVARFLLQLVSRARMKSAADPWAPPDQTIEDGLLGRLYCFQAITKRRQVVTFVEEILNDLGEGELAEIRSTLWLLLRRGELLSDNDRYPGYRPGVIDRPGRIANYSATLMVLLAAASGSVSLSLHAESSTFSFSWWRRQTLLWRSRLDHEAWRGLLETLCLGREGESESAIQLRSSSQEGIEDLPDRAARHFRDGLSETQVGLDFVIIHGEVQGGIDAARLSLDATGGRALQVLADIDHAFGGVGSMVVWNGAHDDLGHLIEGIPGESHFLAQHFLRAALPVPGSSGAELISHFRLLVSTVLLPKPSTPITDGRIVAWQMVRMARTCPPSVDLPNDVRESVLRAAIEVGPDTGDFEYYGECVRAGAAWVAQGVDEAGVIRTLVQEATARLDLLHLVETQDRVGVLELILEIERTGCGISVVAPEMGSLEDWLDRFPVVELVRDSPAVVGQVLNLVRRRRLSEWAGARALPIVRELSARAAYVHPVDVLYAIQASRDCGYLEEQEVRSTLRELVPHHLLTGHGSALIDFAGESWEDARLASEFVRYLDD